jgi:hypothetical protein
MSTRLSRVVRVIPSRFTRSMRQSTKALPHPQSTTALFESISEEDIPFTFRQTQAATHNLAFGIEKFTMLIPPNARYSCTFMSAVQWQSVSGDVEAGCASFLLSSNERYCSSPCAKRGSHLA